MTPTDAGVYHVPMRKDQLANMVQHINAVRKAMNSTFAPAEFADGYMDEPTHYFQSLNGPNRYLMKPSEMMALLRQVERDRAADA